MIDGLAGNLETVQAELADTRKQLENARAELAAPFAREAELAEKTARLMPHRRKMRRRNREHGSWNDNYGPCMSIFGEGYPIDRMSAYRYNNKKKWKGGSVS